MNFGSGDITFPPSSQLHLRNPPTKCVRKTDPVTVYPGEKGFLVIFGSSLISSDFDIALNILFGKGDFGFADSSGKTHTLADSPFPPNS